MERAVSIDLFQKLSRCPQDPSCTNTVPRAPRRRFDEPIARGRVPSGSESKVAKRFTLALGAFEPRDYADPTSQSMQRRESSTLDHSLQSEPVCQTQPMGYDVC